MGDQISGHSGVNIAWQMRDLKPNPLHKTHIKDSFAAITRLSVCICRCCTVGVSMIIAQDI